MPDSIDLVSPYTPHTKISSQSLNLAPFFNTVIVYFVFVQDPHGETWSTCLKCAPIVCLMAFVLLKGFAFKKEYKYSQLILLGLIFSSFGDALLNDDLFPHGMGAFAVAQIFYISAFGWRPLRPILGIGLYVAGAAMVAVVFKNLDDVIKIGLPVYGFLLLTMCWRSIARALEKKDLLTFICAFGGVLFVISDGIICVNMFYSPVQYDRVLVMSTYYAAQFGIALSTMTELKDIKHSKRNSNQRNGSSINSRQRVKNSTD